MTADNVTEEAQQPKSDIPVIFGIIVATVLGFAVAAGISTNAHSFRDVPIPMICAAWAYIVNWMLFTPSWIYKTEKFFDLAGAFTYISTVGLATYLTLRSGTNLDFRSWLIAAMVTIWALRLGSFLYIRVHKTGKDGRFDDIKTNFLRLLRVWTLQGLWVTFTASAAIAVITTSNPKPFDFFAGFGAAIWLFGFTFEVVADTQKTRFKADPNNAGMFITSGLWSLCRHPNYFGEILLWFGVAVMATPLLSGWSRIAFISPIFVTLLLTRISGIPLLTKRGEQRWGHDPDYQKYVQQTPLLIPRTKRN